MDEMRFRILLIEDDRVDQMAFKRFVQEKELPYDYRVAGSVAEAKDILRAEPFDVVITDYLLGDGTAFDIIGFVTGTPVIFVTGAGDEEIAVKAMKAGAYDYLIKDLKHKYLNVLPATAENVIKRKKIEESIEARTAELMRTNEQLRTSLQEKDVLLREVHHRVRNNLQVIYGLLALQSGHIRDKQCMDMCRSLQNIILSMSLVHKTLYKSRDLSRVDFKEYVGTLVHALYESFGVSTDRITLNLCIDEVSFEVTIAMYCGLMINELVSNSLKYAFPDNRKGEITISLESREKGEFELIVRDNGIGIPADLDIKKAETVGLNMIGFFINSMLKGKLEIKRREGTEFIITFRVSQLH